MNAPRPENANELRTVLAGFGIWGDRDLTVSPVLGGLTNSNYRVEVDGADGPFFVKVPGPGTEGFIDRATAADAIAARRPL